MSETANTSYPNPDAAINIYYVIWALFAILVVFLPCYIYPRQRALCFKRIRERRWNVSIEDHQIGSVLEGNLRPRYPPGDPRHAVTKEESEKSKRDFISKRLQNFTKTLQESDFAMKNAVDFGEAVKEANHRRQSMLGNLGHTSTSPISSTTATSPDRQRHQPQTFVQDHLIRILKLPCPGQKLVEDNHQVMTKCDDDDDDDENPNHHQGQDPQTSSSSSSSFREIIPECCICLNDFKSGDVISWSPQHQCSHSFHEECIMKWFLTLCERSEARRARRMNGVECNLQCPVCRQDFISLSETFPQSDILHEEQV